MIRSKCPNMQERSLLRGAILSGLLLLAASAAEIPYPAALDAAAVNLPDVSDISKKGLIVGNGELNAIVYSSGNEIRLRVSKNDCWDMRITTDENPPLPTIDVAKQTFTGEQGKAQPSWDKYVHPTALPCTDISLAGVTGQTAWKSARLDLAKAAATVLSDKDTTTVRVLSQRNVILIESDRAVALNGVSGIVTDREGKPISNWVSAAKNGKRGSLTCLHQNIPSPPFSAGHTKKRSEDPGSPPQYGQWLRYSPPRAFAIFRRDSPARSDTSRMFMRKSFLDRFGLFGSFWIVYF